MLCRESHPAPHSHAVMLLWMGIVDPNHRRRRLCVRPWQRREMRGEHFANGVLRQRRVKGRTITAMICSA